MRNFQYLVFILFAFIIFPGFTKIPNDYTIKKPQILNFDCQHFMTKMAAEDFAQGKLVYFEIRPTHKKYFHKFFDQEGCSFNHQQVYCSKTSWGYKGFFAIPMGLSPGTYYFIISLAENKKSENYYCPLIINKTNYPESHSLLKLGKYSNKTYLQKKENKEFAVQCWQQKKKAFSSFSKNQITNKLSHPRDLHYITSPFGSRRIYEQFKIKNGQKIKVPKRIKTHHGTDFRGKIGSPIFAIANGKVVLAQKMFYEGNFVMIDHGNKIFSLYMHIDKIQVKSGQKVKAGQQIATVGATGPVTGPHLHLGMIVNGYYVDPLSILCLPIKE